MSDSAPSAAVAEFQRSIPEAHRAAFSAQQTLVHELVPDAEVSVKWGSSRAGPAPLQTSA